MTPLTRRRFCLFAAAVAAAPFASRASTAWPSRPVQLLVPGGTGGVIDVRARWLAPQLASLIGQPVVVENKPGAGGFIGMETGARAVPDGHTLVMVHQGTMAFAPFMHVKLPYDPLRDYAPITRIGMGSLALVTAPSMGARTVAEFIAAARARSAPLNYGTPGIGTPPHIATELFCRQAGIRATHIPFKGGGQAASDLIGGHLDFSIEGLTVTTQHVKAGRLVALAVTGGKRSEALPDVPTMREAGLPDYWFEGWVGIAAPAATPPAVVAQIYAALAKVLDTADSRAWFAAAGAEPAVIPPAEFAAFIAAEQARWGPVIRAAGIRGE
jgi:tripartite-type tricarboxylate transporter receptor subunit TctC